MLAEAENRALAAVQWPARPLAEEAVASAPTPMRSSRLHAGAGGHRTASGTPGVRHKMTKETANLGGAGAPKRMVTVDMDQEPPSDDDETIQKGLAVLSALQPVIASTEVAQAASHAVPDDPCF